MKTTQRGVLSLAAIFTILFTVGLMLRAQTDGQATDSALQPVPLDNIPQGAAFFRMSDYLNEGTLGAPWPFLMDTNAAVYWMSGDAFLVDDASITNDQDLANALLLLAQPKDQFSANLMNGGTMTAADSIDPTGGDTNSTGTVTNYAQYTPFVPPTNGLWVEVPTNSLATVGQYSVILHNTSESEPYDVLTSTNLMLPLAQWTVETSVLGATGNFTPVQLAVNGRPNLFVSARFSGSSDDSGIPDWWQLRYFGQTGIDPNADPDGDGWSNVEEYENGTDPNSFDTPPPPHILSATLDGSGNIHLTWAPGGGPVAQYAVENLNNSTNVVSSSDTDDSVPADFEFGVSELGEPTLQVEAIYGDGLRVPSQQVHVGNYGPNLNVQFFRGPGARIYFAVQAAPTNLLKVRILWLPFDGEWQYTDVYATNIVNGVAPVPLDVYSDGYQGGTLDYQLYYTDGTFSPVTFDFTYFSNEENDPFTYTSSNFVSQARQMKENLTFLLRSATMTTPFSYASAIDIKDNDNGVPGQANRQSTWQTFSRAQGSTDYEYYGFHVFSPDLNYEVMDDVRPLKENALWSNFAYNPNNFDATGTLTNGPIWEEDGSSLAVRELEHPNVRIVGSGTQPPLQLPLSTTNSEWIFREYFGALVPGFYGDGGVDSPAQEELGLYLSGTNIMLPSAVRNCYGLFLNSLEIGTNAVVLPGANLSAVTASGPVFMNFENPGLQTVDYYFASQTPYLWYGGTNPPPVPGCTNFTTTNVSPPIITGFNQIYGNLVTVSAWAKQEITNGYAGKYAYLEQYLDKAYQIDSNGNVTTNEAGVISPYGEFFPTMPGPAAIVTMPDIDTGERGTGVVYTIKLQFDVNHDGVMDLSYGGPDNTMNGNGDSGGTVARPFVFWRNDNYDRFTLDSDGTNFYDDDVQQADCPGNVDTDTPDLAFRDGAGNRVISCERDLQDFARLWICGVTSNLLSALPTNSSVTLSLGPNPVSPTDDDPTTGTPTIDLFVAADSDGGIGYLTNYGTAISQTDPLVSPYVGRLGPGQSIQLNTSELAGYLARGHFVFCGVSNGFGEIALTITDGNGNVLAQTRSYIEIKEIKQMYERWSIGDNPSTSPTNVAYLEGDNFPTGITAIPFSYDFNESVDTNASYILYVHGWNMKPWEKDRFAESSYKRLYWQGYQGRFGSFRWPTDNGFTGNLWDVVTDVHNYDNSEFTAWRSAAGLANKLADLNSKYPGHVYVLAHSMGNVVTGEALRLATNEIVNTYVASQAAIPAHVYDSTSTNLIDFTHKNPSYPFSVPGHPVTPNIYGDRLSGNSAAVGRRINFYNVNDYALSPDAWCFDQELKPDTFLSGYYFYNGGTNDISPWNNFEFVPVGDGPSALDIVNNLENRYEVLAYASQPYSKALGATPDISTLTGTLDLQSIWPPDSSGNNYDEHFWHSAQFRGDCWQMWGYWDTLLHSSTKGFNIGN